MNKTLASRFQSIPQRSESGRILIIFAAAITVVIMQVGIRFHLALDEGIYLEAAARVAQGQYRSFFAPTGPGVFWLYGSLFRLFGPSLAISRTLLSCELALICSVIYWLPARCTSRLFAALAAALYLGMLLRSSYQLYINHRWDSNTLAVLAFASLWAGVERQDRKYFLISGILASAAAWTTLPVAIAVAALLIWILFQSTQRKHARFYCTGVVGVSAVALSVLQHQGALRPMVLHLLWSAGNYRSPNSVPYGYLSGDVTQQFAGGRTTVRTAEALLPPLADAGWLLLVWRRKKEIAKVRILASLLAVASAAMLIACYPRFGGHQLLFVTPLFWVFAAAAALWTAAAPPPLPYRIQTQAGEVECSKKHYILLSGLQRMIKPGDGLFVFPYLPMVYFVTGGVNPTRYSFMQPGMMNADDEASVIADLRAHHPRWIIWPDFRERRILQNLHKRDRPCLGCKTITPIRTVRL
jgi:4-amino-4-deoxy-L-arabinose transferase-like glycosyltransferase